MNITILSTSIRQIGELFLLNDIHKASGGKEKHSPNRFTRLQQTKDLALEIKQTPDLALPLKTVRGQGIYACKEMVISYASWISPKINLAVIRAFLNKQKLNVTVLRSATLLSQVRMIGNLFHLNDIQSLKGYSRNTEPSQFFKRKGVQEFVTKEEEQVLVKRTGQHKGFYASLKASLAYARWLDESLYLSMRQELAIA